MAELAPPLATFLREYLPRDRGTSRHTVESYALCFKLLVVFAADKHGIRPCTLEIGHLDIATLLEFLEHLERDRGNGVRTRNARLAAIKAFFRFLEFRHPGYLDLAAQVREIPAKKGDVPLIGSLDRAETRALLDAPDPGTVAGTRDRAMLCLTYNAGLRVSELVGLALDDLKMPALDEVRIIGKGRRERILPLWKETRRALREWLAVRPKSADRHLFLNAMGTGMTRRGFAKRLVLHAQTAARSVPSITKKTVSPHLLLTLARSTRSRRPVTSERSRSGLGTQAFRPPRYICRPIRPTSSIRSTSGALPASKRASSRVYRTSCSRCSQAPETAILMGT